MEGRESGVNGSKREWGEWKEGRVERMEGRESGVNGRKGEWKEWKE
jgi:hypothetical protein